MLDKKLYRLFAKGEASPILVELWANNNYEHVTGLCLLQYIDKRSFRRFVFWISCILFPVLVESLHLLRLVVFPALVLTLFFVLEMLAILYVLFVRDIAVVSIDYSRLLIEDLKKLKYLIPASGYLSKSDLQEAAKRRLVFGASIILSEEIMAKRAKAENHLGLADYQLRKATDQKNNVFKPEHAVFLRFGLVDAEWDSYFKEAEEKINPHAAVKS